MLDVRRFWRASLPNIRSDEISTMTPGKITLALVQMSCTDDKSANVAKALARIGEATAAGAGVVCLQELFATPYPCQSEEHAGFERAEPIPGPTSETLAEAARRHKV